MHQELYTSQGLLRTVLWAWREGEKDRERKRKLKAPFIITCVGSVAKATLRLANATALNTNEALGRSAGGAAAKPVHRPLLLFHSAKSQKGNQLKAFHRVWQGG